MSCFVLQPGEKPTGVPGRTEPTGYTHSLRDLLWLTCAVTSGLCEQRALRKPRLNSASGTVVVLYTLPIGNKTSWNRAERPKS